MPKVDTSYCWMPFWILVVVGVCCHKLPVSVPCWFILDTQLCHILVLGLIFISCSSLELLRGTAFSIYRSFFYCNNFAHTIHDMNPKEINRTFGAHATWETNYKQRYRTTRAKPCLSRTYATRQSFVQQGALLDQPVEGVRCCFWSDSRPVSGPYMNLLIGHAGVKTNLTHVCWWIQTRFYFLI